MKSASLSILLSLLLATLGPIMPVQAQTPPAANLLVKDGQKVVFMGDSITGLGWSDTGGYVHLVTSGLETLGVKITPIPAGVGGNTSREMLARLDKDALSQKPDWLLLSCGVNDVWGRQIDLETFKKNITSIVDQAQAAGIKVLIMTPTPIYERGVSEFSRLSDYAAFMNQLATDRHLPVADLNAAYFAFLKDVPSPDPHHNQLTVDGVHPNPEGHQILAKGILAAFGATPDQIAQAQAAWNAAPDYATLASNCRFRGEDSISLPQFEALKKIAAERKLNAMTFIDGVFMEAVRDALVAHGDLIGVPQDNISSEAVPIFKKKVADLVSGQK